MTAVFFLMLVHAALGLMLALVFVTEKAGTSFFKFCSATAVFMTTAAVGLAWRRFGFAAGPQVLGGRYYAWVMTGVLVSLAAATVYNRAWHFGWQRAERPLLFATLAAGLFAVLAGAAPTPSAVLIAATDLTSIVLLGAAAAAMILGHWYLIVLDLPIRALRTLTVLLVVGIVLRALVVGLVLFGPGGMGGYESARLVATGLWSADGVFVWMRVLFGIAGPASLVWFIWKTVEIRSTQSATGILYVQLFLVLAGELLAKYLRVATGLAL